MYLNQPYKIFYDTKKYPFKEIIKEILEINESNFELSELHNIEKYDLLVREKDQSTKWHKKYYQKFESDFYPLYLELIKELKNRFQYDEIIFQKIPTFRVQLGDGNLGVGEWHKDKTYNHGVDELNFWMSFVDTNDLNCVWFESEEDKGDYRPYNVNYGEILVFNGANLNHGNQKNDSGFTRVSVDFRLVAPNKFKPNQEGSINMKTKFDIGGYFEKI
jgi:hypothetical protein